MPHRNVRVWFIPPKIRWGRLSGGSITEDAGDSIDAFPQAPLHPSALMYRENGPGHETSLLHTERASGKSFHPEFEAAKISELLFPVPRRSLSAAAASLGQEHRHVGRGCSTAPALPHRGDTPGAAAHRGDTPGADPHRGDPPGLPKPRPFRTELYPTKEMLHREFGMQGCSPAFPYWFWKIVIFKKSSHCNVH